MEAQIIAAISKAAPGVRCYHDAAPNQPSTPYVVLQRVGGAGHLHLDTETSDYEARLQLAVWHPDRLTVNRVSREIEAALMRIDGVQPIGAAVADYDPTTSLRGMRQDFYITE